MLNTPSADQVIDTPAGGEVVQLSEEEQIGLAVERLILEASRQLQQAQPQQAEYLLVEGNSCRFWRVFLLNLHLRSANQHLEHESIKVMGTSI